MDTSLQSFSLRADRTAALNAARRASITKADAEQEAQFDDLLSDRKTREAADGSTPDSRSARPVVTHRPAFETASASEDAANPPVQAISVQQAMLAALPVPDLPVEAASDVPVAGDVGGSPGTEPAATDNPLTSTPPLIAPHGPPVSTDDAGPTGGVKAPLIEPHGPPVQVDDGDPSPLPTGGIKAPAIDPHGPPPTPDDGVPAPTGITITPLVGLPGGGDPAPPAGAQDKPPIIRPHGPVGEPTGPVQAQARSDASAQTDDASFPDGAVPTSSLNALAASSGGPAAVPAQGAGTPVPTPSAPAKNEYTTTIPPRGDQSGDTQPAFAPTADPSAAGTFLITSAAQAQIAASMAADLSANAFNAGAAAFSTAGAANLAALIGQTTTGIDGIRTDDSMQVSDSEGLNINNSTGGTPVAKRQDNVMAYPSTLDNATGYTPWSSPDAEMFDATGSPDDWSSDSLRGRAKDGDAAGASAATAPTPGSSTAATAPTPLAAAANAAPSTGIIQVDRMETLLQTVQQTAAQAQFDGTGQVELRVRLAGVADDVTVQVRLDENKQPQVSFQTGSPELRAALEQGWNDLTTNAATAEEATPASLPDFPPSGPVPTDSYRDSRQVFTNAASTTDAATQRWSGYA